MENIPVFSRKMWTDCLLLEGKSGQLFLKMSVGEFLYEVISSITLCLSTKDFYLWTRNSANIHRVSKIVVVLKCDNNAVKMAYPQYPQPQQQQQQPIFLKKKEQ